MRVGRFGIWYGIVLILVGLTTGLVRSAGYKQGGDFVLGSDLLYDAFVDMGVFAPLFAAAVALRKKPELHKRLMIIAVTSLLVPAVWRMPFLGQPPNPWLAHAIWLSPLFLTICVDYAKRRVFHPVMLLGMVALLLQSPMFRPPVSSTEAWRAFSSWLLGLVS